MSFSSDFTRGMFSDAESPPPNIEHAFVRFHPSDNGMGLNPLVCECDPRSFVPRKDPYSGVYLNWGTDDGWDGGMSLMMRRMTKNCYLPFHKDEWSALGSPEEQFCNVLKKKKLAKLQSELQDIADRRLFSRDLILRIELCYFGREEGGSILLCDPPVFRTVSVSGGMTLRMFHDRVLGPAMGWMRNFHGYMYTDPTDGAVFLCEKSQAIDMMHKSLYAWAEIDDSSVKLAQFLNQPGKFLLYDYDLGDHFWHKISVVEIKERDESTAAVELLDGAMACPPENSDGYEHAGSYGYQIGVLGVDWPLPKKQQLEICAARNVEYKNEFDPSKFDLERARERVREAIASKASVQGGEMKIMMDLGGGQSAGSAYANAPSFENVARGTQKKVEQQNPGQAVFAEQTVRSDGSKDKTIERICGNCGSPHNLKVCSKCKLVSYCSADCQKAAWKIHKKTCVSAAKKVDALDPDDDIGDIPPGNINPAIIWEYKLGGNWIPYKRYLNHQLEGLLTCGSPKYMYRPGHKECEGCYEATLSRVPPPGVATHYVYYDKMEEVEIYTGAKRKVRRRGPPPEMDEYW
mmetsp:Transcript_37202/g.72576  ORF Transcript_37202/g.72576 Transcript_37202/m.72576 type:complete len:575 (-) Transcript_37202:184-1908(-)